MSTPLTNAIPSQLIVIDQSVSDFGALIDQLPENIPYLLIDTKRDGIEQLSAALAGMTNLSAIHIISHGAPGSLQLGSTRLDSGNLADYALTLERIGQSLTSEGDLLLYGCNVAESVVGESFIQRLAELTGADVAASDDPTGQALLGGDTVLEQATGAIETTPLPLTGLSELLAVNTAPSFLLGTGFLTTAFGGGRSWGQSVTVQEDGKILVAGKFEGDFALARYNTDGSLDTSFSGDGKVTTDFGSGSEGNSVTVQADGKILVAGTSSNYEFALARYNTDGSLDTSFSGDGKVTTDFSSSYDYGQSVTVQADGKILVAGTSNNGSNYEFALARYNTDGSLDTSFSGDGKLTANFGSRHDQGRSVTVQADGKILVAGYRAVEGYTSGDGTYVTGNSDFALARYNTDGSLDTSFSGDGILTTDFGSSNDQGRSVTVQADGKILVAGSRTIYGAVSSSSDLALARYNTDGSLDTSFSGDGMLTTGVGKDSEGNSVTVQADGKILVAGWSWVDFSDLGDFALARFNTDGSWDASFSGGAVTTNFGYRLSETGRSVTLQADGKILVAGYSDNGLGPGFALARYNTDGSLDQAFGGASTLGGAVALKNSGPAVVMDNNVWISDWNLDSSHYGGASLTLARHDGANADDRFSGANIVAGQASGDVIVSSATIGGYTWANGTLVITFNANATRNLVIQSMSSLAYQNASDAPPASMQIDWTFSDGNTGSQGSGGALSATGSTTITNFAPIITSNGGGDSATRSIAENTTLVTTVTAMDSDTNSSNLRFSIVGGADQAKFSINAVDGKLTFIAAPDFEYPTDNDKNNTYDVVVQVSDGFNVDSQALSVIITNVIESSKQLSGNAGNNTLVGGEGKDTLYGYDGDDLLLGADNNDTLYGGAGDDSLLGGAGDDVLYGQDGNDTLIGGTGNDYLAGGLGNDTYIVGLGMGLDTIDDNDTIAGNADVVVFQDVASTDLTALLRLGNNLVYQYGTADQLTVKDYFLGASYQVEQFSFSDGVTWDDAAIKAQVITHGGTGGDYITGYNDGPNRIFGLDGNDTLYGGALADLVDGGIGDDWLYGRTGDDSLLGGTGDDALYGQDGNDTLIGGTGGDYLSSGAGNDVFRFTTKFDSSTTAYDIIDDFQTGDRIEFTGMIGINMLPSEYVWQGSLNATLDAIQTDDVLVNSLVFFSDGGNGFLYVRGVGTGTAFDGSLIKLLGHSLILGLGEVTSESGNPLPILGSTGNDTLSSRFANDTLIGGAGDDIYIVNAATNTLDELLNEGTDTVHSPLSWTLGANLENLTLLGTGRFSANGNNLENTLTGNAAANILDGGTGADTLIGGDGNDTYVVDNINDVIQETGADAGDSVRSWVDWTLSDSLENLTLLGTKSLNGTGNSLDNSLTGNGAANLLNGGEGNDTLKGLSGNDTLTGGFGADTFAFTTPLNALRNVDTITDFVSGVDKIELASAIFKDIGFTGSPSTHAFFHAGSTAQDEDDRILYDQSTGALSYDADGSGALAAVQFAVLSGAPVMLYTDLLVA